MVQYSVQRQGTSTSIQNNSNERSRSESVKSPNQNDEYESKSDAGSYWDSDGTPSRHHSTTHAHGYTEERKAKRKTTGPLHNSKYKAKLCKNWSKNGFCQYYEKCQFAHGAQELEKWARHRAKYQSDNYSRESKSPSVESAQSSPRKYSGSPTPSTDKKSSHKGVESSPINKDLEVSFSAVAANPPNVPSGRKSAPVEPSTEPLEFGSTIFTSSTSNSTTPNSSSSTAFFTPSSNHFDYAPGPQQNRINDSTIQPFAPNPNVVPQNHQNFNSINPPLNGYVASQNPPQPNIFQPLHPHPQSQQLPQGHLVQQPLAQRGVPPSSLPQFPVMGNNAANPAPLNCSNDWLSNGNDAQRDGPWNSVSRASPTNAPSPASVSSFRSYSCIQQLNESPTMFGENFIAEIASMPFHYLNLDPVNEDC